MDADERVRGYVCDVISDCPPSAIACVARFEAGNRHAVYRVSYRTGDKGLKDVVVRVSVADSTSERERARLEAAVLDKLAGIGAPRLYDFRTKSLWFDTPVMCLQFVDGAHRDLSAASRAEMERLGGVVAEVHDLPLGNLADVLVGAPTIEAYVAERLALNQAYRPRLRLPLPGGMDGRIEDAFSAIAARAEWARSAASFRSAERLVLLHGDVASGNILWPDGPVLIDWEYARIGDPADEIAYVFGQHGLTPVQRDAFWTGYRDVTRGAQSDHLVARAEWWEPVLLLGSVLWWLERWSHRALADEAGTQDPSVPRSQDYYLGEAAQRLAHFDRALAAGPGSAA